jgi:limonene 1,2-monooxygenase
MVANRMVLLDHLARGRVMFGVGPGALVTDAYMLGIDSTVQRVRMDEAMGIILRLFTETDPITYKSDWFELHDALLQIRPYTKPHMPMAVASVTTPSGVALAGKHGSAILSLIVQRDAEGSANLGYLWSIAEQSAAEHGQQVKREEWRIAIPTHIAETRQEAFDDIRKGGGRWQREYFEGTLGRMPDNPEPMDQIVDTMAAKNLWVVGTPDDLIAAIERLDAESGGYGGYLIQASDWAPRDKLLKSYELIARYVMPHFQGSLAGIKTSNRWASENTPVLLEMREQARERALETYAERNVTR